MAKKIAVIGLGVFGIRVAIELSRKGADVIALDNDMERLDDVKEHVAHAVRIDSTDETALKAQGVHDMDVVIVGIGDNFEAALLTIAALQNIGAKRIVVRGTTSTHERILNHLGIKEVILPAEEAAERLATNLIFENVIDSFELSSDYSIAEISAPETFIGRTVTELELRQTYNVNLITIKRQQEKRTMFGLQKKKMATILGIPSSDTYIERGDVLMVFGRKKELERLASA
ncbi:MAG: TrkA family potassium uptake protein [Bacteroidetes bacterium]|nr:TrkA family potassium uptake protein [Bacteroidota bacterium]